uniref:ATP synthase complex subunit 8 n=1 Tax=Cameraria ohridella TaxID=199129 RepID=A0A076EBG1_9NEOP|nr:ATP synthase F0 subunit 8 [Cameraria ohridella]
MPQMMPINWIMLFFFFSTIYMIFIIMNYFNNIYTPKKFKMNKFNNIKNINWKW